MRALRTLFEKVAEGTGVTVKITLADRQSFQVGGGAPDVEIVFNTKGCERRTAFFGYVGFFEAHFDGEVDILGEYGVGKLIRMAYTSSYRYAANPLIGLRRLALEKRQHNADYARAKVNARRHYGLPTALFRALLGKDMCYAEGYWTGAASTLDEAQHERCDRICRKLMLQPGDRLVEVGAGWGYLSMLAAEKYGAEVVVYGLVPEQNAVLHQRLEERGLTGRVRIVEKDHRDLKNEVAAYDKYVSVGVYEHAGRGGQPAWIDSIAASLRPGGIGLISTTSYMDDVPTEYLTIKYVFPGGQVPSLPLTLSLMDRFGLHMVEVEDLSAHYQRTAEAWLANLDGKWAEIQASAPAIFTEKFRRIWTYYLSGVVENFRPGGGNLNLHHITFEKGKGHYHRLRSSE